MTLPRNDRTGCTFTPASNDTNKAFAELIPPDAEIYYRYRHPDVGIMTIKCTEGQLIAAINEYLPANGQRIRRHFPAAGPVGALVFIGSDMTVDDVQDTQNHPGKVIG